MADLSKVPTEELLAMRERASKPASSSLSDIPTEQLLKMRDQAANTERPKAAVGESFGRGLAQGASLGWADEITAGAGAAYQVGKAALGLRVDVSFKDAYGTLANRIRAKDDAAKADNPGAFTAGSVAGGVGASVGTGGLGTSLKGMTALGAATGAGLSEANPLKSPDKLKEFAGDTAKGGLFGFVAGAGGKAIGKTFTALKPSELTKTANIKTLKAAGYMGSELKKMSEAAKQEVGEALHRKGIVKAFDSLDDIAAKASSAKEEVGQEIGKALDGVDDLVKQAKAAIDSGQLGGNLPPQGKEALKAAVDKQFQFNMGRIGERIQKEIIAPNAKNPLLRGEMGKLSSIADDFRGGGSVSMREGNVIKGTQGKVTNFNSDTVPQAFKKEVYDIIKTEIDDIVAKTGNLEAAVGKAGGKSLGPVDVAGRNKSVADAFQGAKKDYGAVAQTADVAKSRLGQVQANREVSLTDTIAAVGGLATGGAPAAMVIGGLNKLSRQYGDSVMAAGARKTAEIMSKAPQILGPFSKVLEESAKRGGPALNATHIALMKDPDFQRILADYESSKTPMGRRLQRTGE